MAVYGRRLVRCALWGVLAALWLAGKGRAAQDSFSAIICSDLHYTQRQVSSVIVAGMDYVEEIADAVMAEVIDRHPDVFFMLGDNTNSGSAQDVSALVEKLRRVKEAGVQVVVITGNHDLDHSDLAAFEEAYLPLCSPVVRDESSFSYVAEAGETVIFAMDDNGESGGRRGSFSSDTLRWLGRELEEYQGRPMLFLSHHNVLLGRGADHSETYRIQNEELAGVLERYGVSLCLTGHLHSQNIVLEGEMAEVVSSTPLSAPHMLGFLEMKDGEGFYHCEPIDFASYGEEGLDERIRQTDEKSALSSRESMASTVAKSSYSQEEQEEILDLISVFLACYAQGSLGAHVEEIRQDPSYEKMVDALWDYNYGPWIKATVEGKPLAADQLRFSYGK